MQNTSAAWVATHKQRLLPETYIELEYVASEPGLQADATATVTQEASFSDAENLISTQAKSPQKYTSLEWNSWGLDGTFDYFEDDPGYTTSTLSDLDAEFTAYPTITVTFSRVHTELIPGITLVWSEAFDEWASSFRITAYNGNAIVADRTVTENTDPVSQVWMDLQNYDRVIVEVISWSHPQHRCRAISLYMGIRTVYTKNDFMRYSHAQSVDLLSAALPKNEVSFALRNEDGRWNPGNPTGAEKYLMERQEISVRYGMIVDGRVEWIEGGRFWLSGWNTPSNGLEASFTARDILEFMNEVYTGPRSGTLYAIIATAFEQAELSTRDDGSVRYIVSDDLKNYSTDFSEEQQEYTCAEVIQLAANMGRCVMYQDRDGVMHVEPRTMLLTDYVIDQNVSYSHPEFEISKPLKAVSVDYGEDQKAVVTVGSVGEVQTVSNEFVKTQEDAQRVAQWTANLLSGRKTISGEYRADPRLDALDVVRVHSKYSVNNVVVTDVELSTSGGAFRGRFSGKAVS